MVTRPLLFGGARLRGAGAGMAGAGCLLLAIVLTVLVMQGVVRVSAWMTPVLLRSAAVLLVLLPVLALAAVPRRTRLQAARWLRVHALLLGTIVWLYALLFTLQTWGWIAVIVGVALFGIGLIPIAILAALVTGAWTALAFVLVGLVVAGMTRVLARATRVAQPPAMAPGEIEADWEIRD